jgi:hypothetical protein
MLCSQQCSKSLRPRAGLVSDSSIVSGVFCEVVTSALPPPVSPQTLRPGLGQRDRLGVPLLTIQHSQLFTVYDGFRLSFHSFCYDSRESESVLSGLFQLCPAP